MIEFSAQIEIERPVAEVFAYVSDPATLPSWQKNTISITQEDEGPLGVGTRLRELHRVGSGELESLVEVTEFEPDRVFAVRVVDGPLPIEARADFAPAGDGTLMTFIGRGEPSGAMKLAAPLLEGTVKQHLRKHCERLKEAIEAKPTPADQIAPPKSADA